MIIQVCAVLQAVCRSLNRTCGKHADMRLEHAPSTYVTDLLVPSNSSIVVDRDVLSGMGIRWASCTFSPGKLWALVMPSGKILN